MQRESLQHILFPECSTLPRESSKKGKNCIKLGVSGQRNHKPIEERSKGWCHYSIDVFPSPALSLIHSLSSVNF